MAVKFSFFDLKKARKRGRKKENKERMRERANVAGKGIRLGRASQA